MVEDCLTARSSHAEPKLVFDLNGQGISLAETDRAYREAMRAAHYIHADGQVLFFVSRLFHGANGLPERLSTTDYFHDAADVAVAHGLRFYLLGASEETIAAARSRIAAMYPGLVIAGARSGYFSEQDEKAICDEIVDSGADVLWLGMGKPKEQLFAFRNSEHLKRVGWIVTCGGLFDFLSGKNSRAPKWMQAAGFEWLYRLCLEPRRLARRYLTTNVHAAYLLLARGGRPLRLDPP